MTAQVQADDKLQPFIQGAKELKINQSWIVILMAALVLLSACGSAQRVVKTPEQLMTQTSMEIQTNPVELESSGTPKSTSSSNFTPIPTYTSEKRTTSTTMPHPTLTPGASQFSDIFHTVVSVPNVLSGKFVRFHSSMDGALWLVTEDGLARGAYEDWSVYLSDYIGQVVGIDADGRIWVVSEGTSSISAWEGTSQTVYTSDRGWTPVADDWYRQVGWGQVDGMGRFWFSTYQDVRVFEDGRWRVFTTNDMGMGPAEFEDLIPEFNVTMMKDTGNVWVGECNWGGPGPFGGMGGDC